MSDPIIRLRADWPDLAIAATIEAGTAADAIAALAELRALVAADLPAAAPVAAAPAVRPVPSPTPAERPQLRAVSNYEPEPESEWPYCRSRSCSRSGEDLIESTTEYARPGDLYCPGEDPSEAAGYCRWVSDSKGWRRKPTKAESDAARAAARGASRAGRAR